FHIFFSQENFAARLAVCDGGIEDGDAKINIIDVSYDASSSLLGPTWQREKVFQCKCCKFTPGQRTVAEPNTCPLTTSTGSGPFLRYF
uniref:Uncharacterized protein n=1 Tax=Stegastes partitus TaxID=144197 RepID=A0A3B4Z1Z9_9TELE